MHILLYFSAVSSSINVLLKTLTLQELIAILCTINLWMFRHDRWMIRFYICRFRWIVWFLYSFPYLNINVTSRKLTVFKSNVTYEFKQWFLNIFMNCFLAQSFYYNNFKNIATRHHDIFLVEFVSHFQLRIPTILHVSAPQKLLILISNIVVLFC